MVQIDNNKCVGCALCVADCFLGNIAVQEKKAVSGHTRCMGCGHCIAVCPQNAIQLEQYDMQEVQPYEKEQFTISPDTLLNFIKFRRSVRRFTEKPIEEAKLLNIIEAGRFTQTGSNSQAVSYIVVKNDIPQLLSLAFETLHHMAQTILSDTGARHPMSINYANMWMKMYASYIENPEAPTSLFFNSQALILIVSESQVDGALAASNMELMANAEGLGTFFSGFFVRAASGNQKIKTFLNIDSAQEVVACMVLGYPDVTYLRTVPRKKANVSWR